MTHTRSLLLLICLFASSAIGAASKPNFVFVLADDASHFDLGCYGGQAHTPAMDALATQGMRFTQCYQSSPTCSPTRHNIYTGQSPFKTGAYPNHTFATPGTKSIVHYLKPLGYRIALSGKTHIKPESVFPFEYLSKGINPDFAAIETFIAECKSNSTPFCLFVTSNEPHAPWDKGDPSRYKADELKLPYTFVDTPETRDAMTRYLAELTYFDGQVGQALGLLDKYKLADNTLFIATTEQGWSLPFAKWTLYDAGLHTGFIVRWPGMVKAGSICDSLIEYSDVVPTFVEAAGGRPDPILDGKSLVPLLRQQTTVHKDYIFSQATTRGIINAPEYFGIRSIRSQKYKYIWNFTPEVRYENVVTIEEDTKWGEAQVFNSWKRAAKTDPSAAEKVRRYHYRLGEELYDLDQDPNEWRNLADTPEYAKVKNELRTLLLANMEAVGDEGQKTELAADSRSAKVLNEN
ncbi:MAG: sulfatase [Verrucomicrobia bacterium]|nr:sulfatase [Verrucomicrobiota bacterium]MDA1066619.1 sulfatase [Verrucomicrobiota bacterium]